MLVANPINRYLINSPMLSDLKKDADGGLTLYVQHDSPGKDKESNWLPAPEGPFVTVMRLYWAKARGTRRHMETTAARTAELNKAPTSLASSYRTTFAGVIGTRRGATA